MTPKDIANLALEKCGAITNSSVITISQAYLDLEKQLAAAKEVVEAARLYMRLDNEANLISLFHAFKKFDLTTSEGSGE